MEVATKKKRWHNLNTSKKISIVAFGISMILISLGIGNSDANYLVLGLIGLLVSRYFMVR